VTRYDDYPNHPLYRVPQEVLDAVRENLLGAVQCGDVRLTDGDGMLEPLADASVLAIVEAGFDIMWKANCQASIRHGPGHQSRARCNRRGPHEVHSVDDEWFWRGDEGSTGFFDDTPDEDEL
jgi:hypothetical protein